MWLLVQLYHYLRYLMHSWRACTLLNGLDSQPGIAHSDRKVVRHFHQSIRNYDQGYGVEVHRKWESPMDALEIGMKRKASAVTEPIRL